MENKFKPQDKVRLGPESFDETPIMVVEYYTTKESDSPKFLVCSWFVDGEKKSEGFSEDALTLVK